MTLNALETSARVPVAFPIVVLLVPAPLILIFPVAALPILRACILVVAMVPAAFKVKFPEIEAVGVPGPTTLIKAKSAEVVEVPPMSRSSVVFDA